MAENTGDTIQPKGKGKGKAKGMEIPIDSLNYKTTQCYGWRYGTCANGIWCGLAHGASDLGLNIDADGTTHGQHLCPEFTWSQCRAGEGCNLSHNVQMPFLRYGGPKGKGKGVDPQSINDPKYKVALCVKWMDNACARGHLCNFAHGSSQLRSNIGPDGIRRGPPHCRKLFTGTCADEEFCDFSQNRQTYRDQRYLDDNIEDIHPDNDEH